MRASNDINSTCGVDLRMMFLPAKLKQAGYATSMIGKSHLGSRSVEHLPINRGFDQVVVKHPTVHKYFYASAKVYNIFCNALKHFGFLGGGEDHYTQVNQGCAATLCVCVCEQTCFYVFRANTPRSLVRIRWWEI